MSYDKLRSLLKRKGTCKSPWYLCGTVDKLLRIADVERTRQNAYIKRKKREGYTDAEIKKVSTRTKKTRTVTKAKVVNLDDVL